MDYFFKYYGVDWLGCVLVILSIYYLADKHKIGFIYGAASSVVWFIFGLLTDSFATLAVNVIACALQIKGYLNWQRNHRPTD